VRRRTGREPLLKPPPRRLRHELFGQTRRQEDDLHRIPSTMSPVCCAAPPMPCDPPRGEHHDGRSAREKPDLQERLDVVATVAPDRRTLLAIPLGGSGPGTGLVMEYTLPEGHPLFVDTTPCVAATFSADAMHLLFARADGTIEVSPQRAAAHVLERARRHVYRRSPGRTVPHSIVHPAQAGRALWRTGSRGRGQSGHILARLTALTELLATAGVRHLRRA
jgi:hypothetical protein